MGRGRIKTRDMQTVYQGIHHSTLCVQRDEHAHGAHRPARAPATRVWFPSCLLIRFNGFLCMRDRYKAELSRDMLYDGNLATPLSVDSNGSRSIEKWMSL